MIQHNKFCIKYFILNYKNYFRLVKKRIYNKTDKNNYECCDHLFDIVFQILYNNYFKYFYFFDVYICILKY